MDRVKITVVGLGRIARTHIDGIKAFPSLCELVSVVDIDERRARSYSKEYQVPYYTSTEEAFADPLVDAVVICLPHSLHRPVTIEACEAKKHVLVEKVMATSLEDGQAMVDAANKNSVNLMVGQSRRFFPALQRAKEMVKKNEIGKVVNFLYQFACLFNVDNAPPWWRSKEATGGLVYPMLGSHSIDFTLWLLDDREPCYVFAQGASNNKDFEGDDDVTLIIEFNDGTHATNYLSINNPAPKHSGLIIGQDGTIFFDQKGDHIGLVGTAATHLYLNDKEIMSGEDAIHNFALQMKEFVTSILEERSPSASGEEILTQLEIIELAQRSALERRSLKLS